MFVDIKIKAYFQSAILPVPSVRRLANFAFQTCIVASSERFILKLLATNDGKIIDHVALKIIFDNLFYAILKLLSAFDKAREKFIYGNVL